jgi:predicted transcriptional regulator
MDVPFLNRDKQVKLAFWKIKEELNEHLDTINQNTGEIQEAFELLAEINRKLDRMDARLERIELDKTPGKNLIQLSMREEEVFSVLLFSEKATLRQISNKLSLPEEIVNNAIFNLLAKGIPILKEMTNETVFIYLDKQFKEAHAKKPIVHVSERILSMIRE